MAEEVIEIEVMPCPFCGAVTALACELDTPRATFAVVCEQCSAQGPAAGTFEEANDVWKHRDRDMGESLSDEELEDAVIARPEVLQRVFAGALLAHAAAECVEAGLSKRDIAVMIRDGLTTITNGPSSEDDENEA